MAEDSPFSSVTSFPESAQLLPYSLPTLSASPTVYCHLSLFGLLNLATIGNLLLHESS